MARTMMELPVRQRGACCQIPTQVDPAWADETARLLKALSDPTRLRMIACLWRTQAPICICDFTAAFDLSQPTISHHMARLRAAHLVESEKRGIWTYYSLCRNLPEETLVLLPALLNVPARWSPEARAGQQS